MVSRIAVMIRSELVGRWIMIYLNPSQGRCRDIFESSNPTSRPSTTLPRYRLRMLPPSPDQANPQSPTHLPNTVHRHRVPARSSPVYNPIHSETRPLPRPRPLHSQRNAHWQHPDARTTFAARSALERVERIRASSPGGGGGRWWAAAELCERQNWRTGENG